MLKKVLLCMILISIFHTCFCISLNKKVNLHNLTFDDKELVIISDYYFITIYLKDGKVKWERKPIGKKIDDIYSLYSYSDNGIICYQAVEIYEEYKLKSYIYIQQYKDLKNNYNNFITKYEGSIGLFSPFSNKFCLVLSYIDGNCLIYDTNDFNKEPINIKLEKLNTFKGSERSPFYTNIMAWYNENELIHIALEQDKRSIKELYIYNIKTGDYYLLKRFDDHINFLGINPKTKDIYLLNEKLFLFSYNPENDKVKKISLPSVFEKTRIPNIDIFTSNDGKYIIIPATKLTLPKAKETYLYSIEKEKLYKLFNYEQALYAFWR